MIPFVTLLIFLTFCLAQEQAVPIKHYRATKTNPHAPHIDGKLNDLIWERAEAGENFLQRDPDEGKPATEKTYFKICYDEKNLYVLIHALDSEPDKIAARLSRRDNVEDSDIMGILVDSYNDHRTAFEFTLNAAGVKYDAVYSNDEFEPDESWDPVWEGKTAIHDSGWIAEMRIPFSQLRFDANGTGTWGLEVYRYIHRKHENIQWQYIPKKAAGFVSLFGRLEGITDIPAPKRIELLPYTVSKLHRYEKETGNPFSSGQSFQATGGLDGKIGLSGNLTVDFTINPDFGQVEADPSEVNLTAFETFFEEKRPFFIEGKNIFDFPVGFGDSDFSRETLFYSRRIGRYPHHYPDLDDDDYAEVPEQTSILGAAKLSGKTAGGWSIGVLDALTAEERAKTEIGGVRGSEVVEPLTNYFIGRLKKDFRQGNSSLGAMVTATNRHIEQPYLNFINKSAYTGGIDISHQWRNRTYFANFSLAGSHVRGHPDALLEVQTSSARYYQRPDANYVTLDSNRTALSGYGGSFAIGRQGNGNWRYALGTVWRSPGLELNDVGYLRQADRIMQFVWIGYRIYNPIGIFRWVSVNFNQWNGWNFGGEKLFAGGNINGGGEFKNYWGFWTGINREGDGLTLTGLRGGPAARYEGGWNHWFNLFSDSRKFWQISLRGFQHWNDDGISNSHNFRIGLFLKPRNNLNISINPFYNIRTENLQYVDTIEKEGGDRYILARMDQKTLGIVFRFNYSVTPNLTVQYYGQPFISAGDYEQFKRVVRPRADRYEDRFENFGEEQLFYDAENEEYAVDEDRDGQADYYFSQPDFNFKQFHSNLVIRWEYHPGSQLYLVWSQSRSAFDEYGNFSGGRDFRDLFSVMPDNIFLIKINHWFSI
ncbi:MAG: hypothetical protein Kow0042_29670 [Calditrichia bacterium]